jgi:hypothetical protein
MNALPKGVGAEPKKLALLGGILVLAGFVFWWQNRSDAPVAASTTSPAVASLKPLPAEAPAPGAGSARTADPVIPTPQRRGSGGGSGGFSGGAAGGGSRTMEDFHPTLKVKDDLDVSKVDPRIQQDLLAKLRAEPMAGGARSLFEFSKAPEPPTPKVAPITPAAVPVPPPAPAPPPGPKPPAAPPPPPPIPFKYYGYAGKAADGQLQGFFREGDAANEEIFTARENETLKNRYKIIRIGIKSALVEDTTNHNQQPLPLLEEQTQ